MGQALSELHPVPHPNPDKVTPLLQNLRTKLLISLLLGIVVVLGLMLYADFHDIVQALARFRWIYLVPILALALFNYTLRFIKWHLYLGQIGEKGVPKKISFLIFFSGLAMAITPGKVGEWLKSYLLAQSQGIPISRSAPIVVAERLTDALGMVLLALGGALIFGVGWQIMVGAVVLAAIAVAIVRYRPLALRLLALAKRLPLLSKRTEALGVFYQSSHILVSPKNLLWATALSVVSWFGECLALYLVLVGLGMRGDWLLLVSASFIMAVSSLAGAVLMLPGGLGAAEVGITGLSQALLEMPKGLAGAATLIIRVCTLWFGVILGMGMLLLMTARLKDRGQ